MSEDNTYIFDPENSAELARLINQALFVTRAMGGVRAGWPDDLPEDAKILDLACGPGGWVLDVAYELPNAEVSGVDISFLMIEYANARARSQCLTNASFGVMDIARPLDFADGSFDLVYARFLIGVLKRKAWAPFITECTRLLRPGGFIQLVEGDDVGRSLSPALETLNNLGIQALWQAGYGFSLDGHTFGMAPGLFRLLKQAGYQDLHLSTSTLDTSAGSEGWAAFRQNQNLLFQQIKPLVISYGQITEEKFDALYRQAMIEMYAEDFTYVGQTTSLLGRKVK